MRWLNRARDFTRGTGETEIGALLDRLEPRYDHVLDVLLHCPQTLLHGEFYPTHIMGGICALDWEMAAVQWLGWSNTWSPPAEQQHDWAAELQRLVNFL